MTEFDKLQIAVGYTGAGLQSLLPAFIMQFEKCEGREVTPEEAAAMAREVHEHLDQLMMKAQKLDGLTTQSQ